MTKEELLERYEALGEERDFLAARSLYEQALAGEHDARDLTDSGYLPSEIEQAPTLRDQVSAFDRHHEQRAQARSGSFSRSTLSAFTRRARRNARTMHDRAGRTAPVSRQAARTVTLRPIWSVRRSASVGG